MTEQQQPDDAPWAAWDRWMAGRRRPDPPLALLGACLPQGLAVRRSEWHRYKQFPHSRRSHWCLAGASAAFLVMAVFLIAGPSDTLADAIQATQAASAIRIHGETSDGRIEMLWVRGVGRRVDQWQGRFRILRVDNGCNLKEFIPEKHEVRECDPYGLDYPRLLEDLLVQLRSRAARRRDPVDEDTIEEDGRPQLRVSFPRSADQKAFHVDPATRRILRIEWHGKGGDLTVYRFEYPTPDSVDRRVFQGRAAPYTTQGGGSQR